METKERKNTYTRPIRDNAVKGVESLEIKIKEKNIALNSPVLRRRKSGYALHSQTSHKCDINTYEIQEGHQESWIEGGGSYV